MWLAEWSLRDRSNGSLKDHGHLGIHAHLGIAFTDHLGITFTDHGVAFFTGLQRNGGVGGGDDKHTRSTAADQPAPFYRITK